MSVLFLCTFVDHFSLWNCGFGLCFLIICSLQCFLEGSNLSLYRFDGDSLSPSFGNLSDSLSPDSNIFCFLLTKKAKKHVQGNSPLYSLSHVYGFSSYWSRKRHIIGSFSSYRSRKRRIIGSIISLPLLVFKMYDIISCSALLDLHINHYYVCTH